MARFSREQIKEKLELVGKGITLIGEYSSKRSKTMFKHVECGHEWMTTLDVVGRLGGGCPKCFRQSRKLSDLEIKTRLIDRDIILVDEYINSHYKIKFQHIECGHIWISKPCDILSGNHGCPKCSRHGFNTEKSAWTYIFERNDYIKYGITNNLEQRLNAHRRNGDLVVHYVKYYDEGVVAKNWENKIKKRFGGHYASKEQCPGGHTETLHLGVLEQLLNLSKELK